jgi:uncharacterized protein involved in exopolysaccharide biosynthesis
MAFEVTRGHRYILAIGRCLDRRAWRIGLAGARERSDMKRMVEYTEPDLQPSVGFAEQIDYVDALPLKRFASEIVRGRSLILIMTIGCLVLAGVVALVLPRSYDARVMVAPVVRSNDNPSSQQLRNLAASVTGITLANPRDNANFDNFQHMLTSVSVAERLESDHRVLQTIYRREWNSAAKSWVPPQGIASKLKRIVLRWFGLPGWAPPSPVRLADDLSRELRIVSDPRSEIITISYSNKDPIFAGQLVNWVCQEADRLIKEREQISTQQQIAYIDNKLRAVTIEEHRRALTQLLLELERKGIMTAIDQPYAARVIDGPRVPDLPDSPKPFLNMGIGALAGFMLGCALVLYRGRWGGKARPARD